MGETRSTQEGDEKLIQEFSCRTWKGEIISET